MSTAKSKADFIAGENGAALKLSKEKIGSLEEFGLLICPTRGQYESAEEFEKALAASAEHILNLSEGKLRTVGKTTYKELKTIFDGIKTSGYFYGKNSSKSEMSDGNEATRNSSNNETPDKMAKSRENRKKPSQNGSEQEKRVGGRRDKKRSIVEEATGDKGTELMTENDQYKPRPQYEANKMVPQNVSEQQAQALQQQADAYTSLATQQPNMITESSHQPMQMTDSTQSNINQQYDHAPQQVSQQRTMQSSASAPGIDFLQESQIDMESPHMDPAVVVVHHSAPPTQGQNSLPQANQNPVNIATTVQNQVLIMTLGSVLV